MAQTLYDKLMATHVVREEATTALIYIDRQLIHEVTSPQAFEGLEIAGRKPWRLEASLAVPDHNVPTTDRASGVGGIEDPISKFKLKR
jgi:3-isopropylmalate dehydratase, large subunit (EC 4.2.1.33)